jgi:hypothetical protein
LNPITHVLPATALAVTGVDRPGPAIAGPVPATARVASAQHPHLTAGRRTGDGARPPAAVATAAEQHTTVTAAQPAGGQTGHRPLAGTDRAVAMGGYRADHVETRHGPFDPRPAPMPAYPDPGLLNGAAPGGTSTPHQGSTAALVTGTVMVAPDASRRSTPAVQVEAIRLIAEAPTVSPD